MFGLLHQQAGNHAQALRLLDKARVAAPLNAAVCANRAGVHLALSQYAEAEADALAALAIDATSFAAAFNLGLALLGLRRVGAAAAAFARASAARPQHARALLEWFSAAARADRATGLAERSREPLPSMASDRALALRVGRELERFGYANQAFAVMAQLRVELPDDAEVRYRYGVELGYRQACLFEYRADSDAALAATDALIATAPWHRSVRMLRASLLGERGLVRDALDEYTRIIALVPDDAKSGSAYLIALQHDPARSAEAVAAAHRVWAARHTPVQSLPASPRQSKKADTQDRPLRIGWLSPRFFAGLVETFFATVLERLDRSRMSHVLFDSGAIDDAATTRFRQAADVWHTVEKLDDEQLCALIRAERIDVLVELNGHGPGNRLRALASRPAAVQVTWLDYFHSTGSQMIDVLLSDAVLSPPESFVHYSECVMHLPSGRICYTPPAGAPCVAERSAGPLRLACFNRLSKINDAVLQVWARVLLALPGSVLKLKMRAFDDAGHRAHFLARASGYGIEPARLQLVGYGTHVETLLAYADVDIALDPFPFSGCATSCDALWMGVPVVTLIGDTMVSRQTASLLTSVGLADCIAIDADAYVRCVVALAADADRRNALRAQLRECTRERLCDADRHAHELADALREAWHRYGP